MHLGPCITNPSRNPNIDILPILFILSQAPTLSLRPYFSIERGLKPERGATRCAGTRPLPHKQVRRFLLSCQPFSGLYSVTGRQQRNGIRWIPAFRSRATDSDAPRRRCHERVGFSDREDGEPGRHQLRNPRVPSASRDGNRHPAKLQIRSITSTSTAALSTIGIRQPASQNVGIHRVAGAQPPSGRGLSETSMQCFVRCFGW
jgi:hypothetical protein